MSKQSKSLGVSAKTPPRVAGVPSAKKRTASRPSTRSRKRPAISPIELSEIDWNDFGARMLSLRFMDVVMKCFPKPFRHDDLAEVLGKSPAFVHRLCTGDSLLTIPMLQTIQREMRLNWGLRALGMRSGAKQSPRSGTERKRATKSARPKATPKKK